MAVAARSTPKARSRRVLRGSVPTIVRYAGLITLGIVYAFPFVWMISISLKPDTDLNTIPPHVIPSVLTWSNYPKSLFQPMIYFPRFFLNTIEYVVLAVLGETFVSALVGYAFARIPFKGSNFMFGLVLSTMMLPSQVTLIPQYIVFRDLGWLDSLKPLIIPAWFGGAFFIFLFRQFFMTIPREIDDAAFIDGASHFDILWRIMVPLSVPVMVTAIALSVVARWNDFFGPLIYVNTTDRTVLAVALTFFNVPGEPSPQNLLMAASVVTIIPVILIFLFLQDYFVQGVTLTGLREG